MSSVKKIQISKIPAKTTFIEEQFVVFPELAWSSDAELKVANTGSAGAPGVYFLDNNYIASLIEIDTVHGEPFMSREFEKFLEEVKSRESGFLLSFVSIPTLHLGLEKLDERHDGSIASTLGRYQRKSLGAMARYAPPPAHTSFRPHDRRLFVGIKLRHIAEHSNGSLPSETIVKAFICLRHSIYKGLQASNLNPRYLSPSENNAVYRSIFCEPPTRSVELREDLHLRDQVFTETYSARIDEIERIEGPHRYAVLENHGRKLSFATLRAVNVARDNVLTLVASGLQLPVATDIRHHTVSPIIALNLLFPWVASDAKNRNYDIEATLGLCFITEDNPEHQLIPAMEYLGKNSGLHFRPTDGRVGHVMSMMPMGFSIEYRATHVRLFQRLSARQIARVLPIYSDRKSTAGELVTTTPAGQVLRHTMMSGGVTIVAGENLKNYFIYHAVAMLSAHNKKVAIFDTGAAGRLASILGGESRVFDFTSSISIKKLNKSSKKKWIEMMLYGMGANHSIETAYEKFQDEDDLKAIVGRMAFSASVSDQDASVLLKDFLTEDVISTFDSESSLSGDLPQLVHFQFNDAASDDNAVAFAALVKGIIDACRERDCVFVDCDKPDLIAALLMLADTLEEEGKNLVVFYRNEQVLKDRNACHAVQHIVVDTKQGQSWLHECNLLSRDSLIYVQLADMFREHKIRDGAIVNTKDGLLRVDTHIPQYLRWFYAPVSDAEELETMALSQGSDSIAGFMQYLKAVGYQKTHPEMRVLEHLLQSSRFERNGGKA